MAEVQPGNSNVVNPNTGKPAKPAPTPKDQLKPEPGRTIDHQDNNYTTPEGEGRIAQPEQPKK